MELELKHIVGYLPYGLNIQYKSPFSGGLNIKKIETNAISYSILNKDKPILHPLSDLTKDENFELYLDLCEELGVARCEHLLFALKDGLYYALDVQKYSILEDWMYKNHFDWKYNLIEKGLAIDKNTIM